MHICLYSLFTTSYSEHQTKKPNKTNSTARHWDAGVRTAANSEQNGGVSVIFHD